MLTCAQHDRWCDIYARVNTVMSEVFSYASHHQERIDAEENRRILCCTWKGTKMSHTKKYPVRCLTIINGVKCGTRRSLSMRPSEYSPGRIPKCPHCGGTKWVIDTYRIRVEMAAGRTCACSGYHFFHRKGSKFCFHHPKEEENHSERYSHV